MVVKYLNCKNYSGNDRECQRCLKNLDDMARELKDCFFDGEDLDGDIHE